MKANRFWSILMLLSLASFSAFSQDYKILRTERIAIPFENDTTYRGNLVRLSVTPDGKIVYIQSTYPNPIPIFYFYDDFQKKWSKKQLDSNKWGFNSTYGGGIGSNSVGFNFIYWVGYIGIDSPFYRGVKWIVNYGDSIILDTSKLELGYDKSPSPSISYYSTVIEKSDYNTPDFGGKAYSSFLYRRRLINGNVDAMNILSLEGIPADPGANPYSIRQNYKNDLYYWAIDDQTVIAEVQRFVNIFSCTTGVTGNYYTEKYNLLSTNGGKFWTKLPYDPYMVNSNSDNQWFVRIDSISYLYSSPRHGIIPKNPIDLGFINKHLKIASIGSKYVNGEKEYYCFCSNKTDTSEMKQLIMYAINPNGQLQKYYFPKKTFEFKDITHDKDSTLAGAQIFYADDSIMYIQIMTGKYEGFENDYRSQPQIYKIYLKETVSAVAELPIIAPIPKLLPYPNPVGETLRWNTATGTAVITDALSRTLLEVPASAMEADVSVLATGMYFLTIRDGVGSSTRSFVVVR